MHKISAKRRQQILFTTITSAGGERQKPAMAPEKTTFSRRKKGKRFNNPLREEHGTVKG